MCVSVCAWSSGGFRDGMGGWPPAVVVVPSGNGGEDENKNGNWRMHGHKQSGASSDMCGVQFV